MAPRAALVALAALVAGAAAQVKPMSNADISSYQIVLWTSVGLAAVLLAVIYVMLGMDETKDAGIHAQIVDARAAKKQS